ncbi:hypothetical protein EJ06DRAFT_559142 [Trichodelitschia bisporula]|uniref:Uncharacterized protein n=1 Tax=Trichodelitschia bisporula TaxID=703511 RepID=A0A6G1HNF4_9PEZI|nr:hypothetical protein EJ06DRAFT_559142 [Trichodelitschia bisporula]
MALKRASNASSGSSKRVKARATTPPPSTSTTDTEPKPDTANIVILVLLALMRRSDISQADIWRVLGAMDSSRKPGGWEKHLRPTNVQAMELAKKMEEGEFGVIGGKKRGRPSGKSEEEKAGKGKGGKGKGKGRGKQKEEETDVESEKEKMAEDEKEEMTPEDDLGSLPSVGEVVLEAGDPVVGSGDKADEEV